MLTNNATLSFAPRRKAWAGSPPDMTVAMRCGSTRSA